MDDEKQASFKLSDIEKSAIGEICDLITASVAQAFSERVGSDVPMNPSSVDVVEFGQVPDALVAPVLLLQLSCTASLDGQLFMFILGEGLPKVFDVAIPEDAKEVGADDDVILEGLREIIDGAVDTAMANFAESMGHSIQCSIIDTIILQDESSLESISFLYPEGTLLYVASELAVLGDAVQTGYLLPMALSSQIIELLLNEQSPAISVDDVPVQDVADEQDDAGEDESGAVELEELTGLTREPAPAVRDLQPATFTPIDAEDDLSGKSNISLLLDVMLDASIELGKTQMTIENILKLGRGSVIELDKLASEPVEFLVNGKVIARGEVVVIDDNFGIRITEILSPKARLENL